MFISSYEIKLALSMFSEIMDVVHIWLSNFWLAKLQVILLVLIWQEMSRREGNCPFRNPLERRKQGKSREFFSVHMDRKIFQTTQFILTLIDFNLFIFDCYVN